MNQQIALPVPYSHPGNHELGGNGSTPYPFHPASYTSYGAPFNSTYHQQSSPSTTTQHLSPQYSSGHSTSDQMRFQHPPPQYITQSRYFQSPRYLPLRDALNETDIESQDSANESTMRSEPLVPPVEGFPNVGEFDQLMKRFNWSTFPSCSELGIMLTGANRASSYVDDLSVKKQDKALIHARRARNIRTVLVDPKGTAIESAQFRCVAPQPLFALTTSFLQLRLTQCCRFWVKKMFKLQSVGIGNPDVCI